MFLRNVNLPIGVLWFVAVASATLADELFSEKQPDAVDEELQRELAEIGLGEPTASPDETLRQFLLAMLSADAKQILDLTLPYPDESVLWKLQQEVPPELKRRMRQGLTKVEFQRHEPGEELTIPGGHTLVVEDHEDIALLSTPASPLPTMLLRVGGKWKVDPSPMIAVRKAGAKLHPPKEEAEALAWQPQPQTQKYLGEPARFADYSIQPPKGMDFSEHESPGGKSFLWHSKRNDGSQPFLIVSVGERDAFSPERMLYQMLQHTLAHRRDKLTPGELQHNSIAGMPCVRTSFSGRVKGAAERDQAERRGMIYLLMDGETAISIMAEDAAPHAKKTLPVIEAAILSLRKPPAEDEAIPNK